MDPLPPPGETLGPMLLKFIWTGVAFATIFLGFRMFSRIKVIGHLNLDDYLMALALLFGIVSGATSTASVNWGLGSHIFYLSNEQISQAIKYQYITQPFAYLALVFGRVSFAVSLLALIGTNKTRCWILYSLILGQFLINVIYIGLGLGQCNPPEKYWNPTVAGTCLSLRVIEVSGYVQGSWNIFTDFALAVLPGVVISDLNMKLRTRLGLIFLMGLGIVNMAAAIVTIVEISRVGADPDFTYGYITVDIWGVVQTYLAIIVASIPFIRPLFHDTKLFSLTFYRSFLGRYSYRSRRSGQENSYRHRGNEGYTAQEEKDSVPRLGKVPRDRFVTTTLRNVMADDFEGSRTLRGDEVSGV